MNKEIKNHIPTLLLVFIFTGCVFAPGWKMSDPPTVPGVKIVPITEDLIYSQRRGVDVFDSDASDSRKRLATAGAPRRLNDLPYRYLIGPRDVLNITVWDHAELTIPAGQFRSAESAGHLVSEDGTIFYPFMGKVKVAGKTVDEVREILTQGIAGKIVNPQLDVRVAAYRSQRVFIFGQVQNPGPQPITDVPMTLLNAIDQAGDATNLADKTNVTLKRNGNIYRINLLEVYEQNDQSQNYLLQDGDIVHVPDLSQQIVFVLGEVVKPSTIPIKNGKMNLTEALGTVGGVDQLSSNPELLYVIRSNSDKLAKSVIYYLDSQSPDTLILASQFPLQAGDVVFVGTAGVTRWNRVFSQILPTAGGIRTTRDIVNP